MTIIELNPKGAITLPENIRRQLGEVSYLQVAETRKGILLVPVHIQPAATNSK